MKKTLGLDLGANSIGWAIIENDKIREHGTRRMLNNTESIRKTNYIETIQSKNDLFCIKNLMLGLVSFLAILSILNNSNWQFWFGLSFSTLLTYFTLKK